MGQAPLAGENRITVNGVPVYVGRSGIVLTYDAPSLGVEVEARGSMAPRILATLTPSPRAAALGAGPAPSVPPSWRPVSFSGLRFSVPADWPVNRTEGKTVLGSICRTPGVALIGTTVTLSTNMRALLIPECFHPDPPTPRQPLDGVLVAPEQGFEPLVPIELSPCFALHGGMT